MVKSFFNTYGSMYPWYVAPKIVYTFFDNIGVVKQNFVGVFFLKYMYTKSPYYKWFFHKQQQRQKKFRLLLFQTKYKSKITKQSSVDSVTIYGAPLWLRILWMFTEAYNQPSSNILMLYIEYIPFFAHIPCFCATHSKTHIYNTTSCISRLHPHTGLPHQWLFLAKPLLRTNKNILSTQDTTNFFNFSSIHWNAIISVRLIKATIYHIIYSVCMCVCVDCIFSLSMFSSFIIYIEFYLCLTLVPILVLLIYRKLISFGPKNFILFSSQISRYYLCTHKI